MKGSITLVLTAMASLSACASTSKEKDGLREVDTLVNRIERVHVETELAQTRAHDALASLQSIVAPDFAGNSMESFGAFVDAVEFSETQAEELENAVKPMQKSADLVFATWTEDLDAFSSPLMRQRSGQRLDETRGRFDAVRAANDLALASVVAFNLELRDHILYLQHNFNPAAVADLQSDVELLGTSIENVDGDIEASLAAAREYVQASALPRRIESEPTFGPEPPVAAVSRSRK